MISRRALALALLLAPATAPAQFIQPVQSDADRLADQMRRIGANAQDMDALLTAGELSVRMGDMSAAGAFFARAEKIDARNGRAKAGEAAILVQSERPGEALRYFTLAEQLGYPAARFAGDRGLAYDLLGDPGRAQRDYKLALGSHEDAEVRRRLALSLGIVGRQTQALDALAPLIRQNDHAAWRARAFILAMSGNAGEASRIAQTMMPPGAATGLASFFAELPRLSTTDRAFAVNFGEVHATPQRLADARIAPRETPLALEPLPVQVAAIAPPPPAKNGKRDKRRRDDARVQVAAVLPVPVAPPQPAPPAYQAPAYAPLAAATPLRDRPLTAGEQASLSAVGMRAAPSYRRPTAPVQVTGLTSAEQASLAAASGARPAWRATPVSTSQSVQIAAAPYPRPVPPSVVASIAPAPYATPRPIAPAPGSATPTPYLASHAAPAAPPAQSVVSAAPYALPRAATVAPAAASDTQASVAPRATVPAATVQPALPAVAPQVATAVTVASVAPTPLGQAAPVTVTPTTPGPGFSSSPTAPPAGELAAVAQLPTAAAAVAAAPAAEVASLSPAQLAPAPLAATAALANGGVAGPPVSDASIAPAVATTSRAIATIAVPATIAPPVAAPRVQASAVTRSAPARLAREPLPPIVRPGRRADAVLARIVAGLSVPASELGIEGPTRPATKPAGGRRIIAAAPVDDAPVEKTAAQKAADAKKAAATKKALADKKAAADKKALADKEAADAKKAERAQPARIWVQVAGGANEAGLTTAWKVMRGKAPAVLAGHQAYTTPLRATNRVLTGPFRTDAEARAYVNQLNKAGVNAFTFTSDAGQKITKLDAK